MKIEPCCLSVLHEHIIKPGADMYDTDIPERLFRRLVALIRASEEIGQLSTELERLEEVLWDYIEFKVDD